MTDLMLEQLREVASEQDVLEMLRRDAFLIRGPHTSAPLSQRETKPKKKGFFPLWAARLLRLSWSTS